MIAAGVLLFFTVVGVSNADDGIETHRASLYGHERVAPDHVGLSPEGEVRTQALMAFYKGARLQTRGNYSGAQRALEAAVELDPNNVDIALRLARIAAALNQPQHGLQVLRDSLMRNPTNPEAYLQLARFCEDVATRLEKNADADPSGTSEGEAAMLRVQGEDASLMAVERFPEQPSTYWQLLRLYLAQDRKEHAQAMMGKAIAREDPDPHYWLEIGQQAQQAWPLSDLENSDAHLRIANGAYEKALAAAGDSAEVLDQIADYYSQTRQYDTAVELYERIIAQSPGMLLTREKLARVLGVLERHDEKLTALKELVQINPHDARIQKFIGSEYEGRNDPAQAITHYLAAIKAGENDSVFYHELIELMLAEGMTDEALPVIKRAHFLYPDAFSINVQLARAYADLKQWDASLRAFKSAEKGVDEDEKSELLDDHFYFDYASAASAAKQHARAAALFRKSSESAPKDAPERAAKAYDGLALVWLDQGERIAEARELIMLALDLEPDSTSYLTTLGRCHYLRGNYDEAVETLRKVEAATAASPSAALLNQLAMALFRSGDHQQAIAALERAIALADATEDMTMRLAAYQAGEDPDPVLATPVAPSP